MEERTFVRIAAVSAAGIAALSLLYAIAFLGIAPSDQRGSDIDRFMRSYLQHPAGLRIASLCLAASGVLSGVVVVALTESIERRGGASLRWAAVAGVAGGLLTAAHALGDLVGVDKLAHLYASGDSATRAAASTANRLPSSVDPRGLITFGLAGAVVLVLSLSVRDSHRRLGQLGVVLGVDMMALFMATAFGVNGAVLLTGGLASVVLGPVWWCGVARLLWAAEPERA